ncbi:MAG: DUF853 family protein [Myxococcales bacterium]|nr:DUF853 family protein [Myxococcales bacterium]
MASPRGKLHLGAHLSDGQRTDAPLHYDRHHLTTHGVIAGMTGSGKTGLGVVLLEEVLRQGVPALIIDPKGDMGNLLLSFPELQPADFAPWIDAGEAARKDVTSAQLADSTAQKWQKGLAGWGLGSDDIKALRSAADLQIWTPGSTAGNPINVVGSLRAPAHPFDEDAEGLRAEIESFVSSLLVLADLDADPISSREHILLCHLIEKAWRAGRDMTLGGLIRQVSQPPIRRLGVFELEEFFPEKQRAKLAMRLNGLVASPSFSTWMQGEALDIETLLYAPDGRPRASVMYLPHLAEEQRQFVVTLLLSKVVTWMRKQPGTSDLRALIYMDEVFGFAPPTKNPPSKKPILTLLKQARAHGVGMVLSTQNPVDLDYKAMSNAGTWVIGRLSTERDKARVVEALKSAAGDTDVAEIDKLIGALGKRQFVMMGARQPQPAVFTTRWALSFLRGPLTRSEVARLCRDKSSAPAGDAPRSTQPPETATQVAARSETSATSTAANPAPVEVTLLPPLEPSESAEEAAPPKRRRARPVEFPPVAEGVPVHYLDPAAPWADLFDVDADGESWRAAVVARVELRFGDDVAEQWEAVGHPLNLEFAASEAISVDWDARDLSTVVPTRGRAVRPVAPIEDPDWWAEVRVRLQTHLDAQRTVDVSRNDTLGLVSRISESRTAFAARCRKQAEHQADIEAAQRSRHYAKKMHAWRAQLDATTYKIDAAEAEAVAAVNVAERLEDQATLLAATLKGHMRASDVAAAVAKREVASAKLDRARNARSRVDAAWADLARLEDQLGAELSEIHRTWLAKAGAIVTHRVERQAVVHLDHIGLLWMPMGA